MSFEPTEEEKKINAEIKAVYNGGDCGRALEMSIAFLKSHPGALLARYSHAVMHGDYSYNTAHGPEERKRLLDIAKKEIKTLFEDPNQSSWPEGLRYSTHNEYFWFFEMHEEQYNLGTEKIKQGLQGNYSACVGAASMALKQLRSHNLSAAEEWARKALYHFTSFEEYAPNWYNINYFSAQAFACLGDYEVASQSFKDMFRKQQGPVNAAEVEKFDQLVSEIKGLRDFKK